MGAEDADAGHIQAKHLAGLHSHLLLRRIELHHPRRSAAMQIGTVFPFSGAAFDRGRHLAPHHKTAQIPAGCFLDECLHQQDFQPPAPNRRWAGDITYIRTTAGWRYLAVWINLFSRRAVGWKLDHPMDAPLVIESLNRALGHRRVEPEQLLVHTEQGSQYRATDYRDLLHKHGLVCSMSAKGCCWDNAVVESFFSTLRLELDLDCNREELISPQQLQRDLAFWIEGYYNRERRQSTIGYLSPIDYEQQFIVARTLTHVPP